MAWATTVEVVMFTTEGLILAARSAKLSGAPRAAADMACDSASASARSPIHSARTIPGAGRVSARVCIGISSRLCRAGLPGLRVTMGALTGESKQRCTGLNRL